MSSRNWFMNELISLSWVGAAPSHPFLHWMGRRMSKRIVYTGRWNWARLLHIWRHFELLAARASRSCSGFRKEAGIFRRGFVRPDKSQAGNAPQGVLHQTPTHVPLADSKEAFSRVVVYGPLCPGSSLRPFRQEYPSFLSWIGLRLECLESEVDLENVSQFPTDVILRFFTDYYHVAVVNLDPRMLGTLGLAQRVASLISLI